MVLAAVAAFLAVSVVYVALENRATALNLLEMQVSAAKKDAEAAMRPREEIDRLIADNRFLADRKANLPSVLSSLDALTRVLPDHTWLSDFSMKGAKIQISGSSASASSLIGLVNNSPHFDNPSFRSSVSQDPRSGLERFTISLEVQKTGVQ